MADPALPPSGLVAEFAAWLGPTGTLVTIVGLAVSSIYLPVRSLLNGRAKTDTAVAKSFRDELRAEVRSLRLEIDEMRERYEGLFEAYLNVRHHNGNLVMQVKSAGLVPVEPRSMPAEAVEPARPRRRRAPA